MKRPLPLFVLLASALVFLTSLFLPWRDTTVPPVGNTVQGLLNQFSGDGRNFNGWLAIAGDVAVVLVVAIVLATLAALRRPQLAARLPIGGLGVALGYFAVAVAVEVNTLSREFSGGFTGHPQVPHTSWAYGFYLGLASAGVAVLGGLAFRLGERPWPRGIADLAAVGLGVALLVSFLLPWIGFHFAGVPSTHGTSTPPAVIAALGLILGAGWLYGETGRRWRLPVAIAAAILTGAAASVVGINGFHRYGTWIGIGCAVSIVALEAVRAWPVRLPGVPRGLAALRLGAAGLLILALFLPWQELNVEVISGRGYDGWYSATGAAAGSICLLLLATPALPALENYVLDAVVAIAIFVSTLGTGFREESSIFKVGYGAYVGFAAAGILLVTALLPLRPGHVSRERALARAAPLAASVLCIAAVVVPFWFVLPQGWTFQAAALRGSLAVPGVLLGLYLVRLWAGRVRGPSRTGNELVLVPVILLALASLELIRFRNGDVIWAAIILVGLCLLLILFGWIEEDSGLESLRAPEALRVDRLPETES